MSTLTANQAQLITFTLLSTLGVEVTGLGSTFTVTISKNGGAFAASAGTKAEIGSGWYSYQLTAAETDTAGPLSMVVTGAGADQLNLAFDIRPYYAAEPSGSNILTAAEAAKKLRCETTDPLMLALLPLVDSYIKNATGHDWAADSNINPTAKDAAMDYIDCLHEGGWRSEYLQENFIGKLNQLEALGRRYMIFEGLPGAGYINLPGAREGDTVTAVTGIVGITGDQSSKFESVVSITGYIQQISADNLDEKFYRVLLTPLEASL